MNGIVFVHAHPDDETIATGAAMARYAAAGVPVTLVTCTLGEEGEVSVPELAGLAAGAADQLGGYRLTELAAACAALGVTDHRFLGGLGTYRDSGMIGTPSNDHPRAFWGADLDEAAGALRAVLREVRPRVLVTYGPDGGYGHPDHIMAHRVAVRAAELAAADGYGPAKTYWTAMPRAVVAEGLERFAGRPGDPRAGGDYVGEVPFGTPDAEVTTRIAGPYQAKAAAIRAHATQIPPDSWLHAVASGIRPDLRGVEFYTLAAGDRGPDRDPDGYEPDLLA